ncbi:hypothetical protein ALC56_14559 [Trachymyrmex septentrionalis]|uniref:Uncharacterized protein n=1 Tax=Trachymyrmex septentrionalis TaxID=34720 RepID=A0A195ETD4_9HYME|nr:hypothetical protein ALC56_14559 [Trachymyrmex septentrionalis]
MDPLGPRHGTPRSRSETYALYVTDHPTAFPPGPCTADHAIPITDCECSYAMRNDRAMVRDLKKNVYIPKSKLYRSVIDQSVLTKKEEKKESTEREERSKTRSRRFRKKRGESEREKRILKMSCEERGAVRGHWQKAKKRRRRRDTFQLIVGDNPLVTKKFHYLKSCLERPAEKLIRSVVISALLCKHYENKKELARSNFSTFTAVAKMKSDTAEKLNRIYNAVTSVVNDQERKANLNASALTAVSLDEDKVIFLATVRVSIANCKIKEQNRDARFLLASNTKKCYLPHHEVLRESSATTKIKVVFNGSQRIKSGESFNSRLLIGANLLPALAC